MCIRVYLCILVYTCVYLYTAHLSKPPLNGALTYFLPSWVSNLAQAWPQLGSMLLYLESHWSNIVAGLEPHWSRVKSSHLHHWTSSPNRLFRWCEHPLINIHIKMLSLGMLHDQEEIEGEGTLVPGAKTWKIESPIIYREHSTADLLLHSYWLLLTRSVWLKAVIRSPHSSQIRISSKDVLFNESCSEHPAT